MHISDFIKECDFKDDVDNYNDDLYHGDTSFEDWLNGRTNDCRAYFYADILNIYFKHLGYADIFIYFDFNNPDKNKGFFENNGS